MSLGFVVTAWLRHGASLGRSCATGTSRPPRWADRLVLGRDRHFNHVTIAYSYQTQWPSAATMYLYLPARHQGLRDWAASLRRLIARKNGAEYVTSRHIRSARNILIGFRARFLPRCMACRRHGSISHEKTDHPSVCPSVGQTRGLWQDGRKFCPYHCERTSVIVFRHEEWLVGEIKPAKW